MARFSGKRIVLTGASRGVGFESAKQFLAEGAEVLGIGRDLSRLDRAAFELGALGRFIPFRADLDEPSAPARIAGAAAKTWPAVDLLINNAAVQTWKSDWYDEGLGLLERQWRGNVFAPHELIFRMVPLLEKGVEPRIVNVSSGAGTQEALRSSPDMPTYRLTKYALGGVTLLWAAQLKGRISVNALDPGWLKTDLGGPKAPGEPADGGQRMVEICSLPWAETGKFWHGTQEISF